MSCSPCFEPAGAAAEAGGDKPLDEVRRAIFVFRILMGGVTLT